PCHSFVAIHCVCVGIGAGGSTPMLARICVVDGQGNELLPSTFVRPTAPVADYRTDKTGIQAQHLASSESFSIPFGTIQQTVARLLRGKTLVGHKVILVVLGIAHPAVSTRDLALYMPYRTTLRAPNHIFELKELISSFMMRRIQVQGEEPAESARASMDLYRTTSPQWETAIANGQWPCAIPPSQYSRCY
ncbi:hypothetical protein EXIGLDRAFT_596966, partial [Exidia glandulosa HHB12029]